MTVRAWRSRFRDAGEEGPGSVVGVSEAGKTLLALLFCLAIAAGLVAAFWASS